MNPKRITASLLLLLSTTAYSMDHVFILEEPKNQCAGVSSVYSHAFSSLHRFSNDDSVSNLRFIYGQEQWDPTFSGHLQSILNYNFPIDSMTQFVQLLFPSPTGDYLVANQSTDIIAKTKASKFYNALIKMRADGAMDVWGLFELLFDRQLSPFAKEIVIAENNNFCIESYATAVKREAMAHQISIDKAMEHLKKNGFFQDGFLTSEAGGLFMDSLEHENRVSERLKLLFSEKIEELKKRKKDLENKVKHKSEEEKDLRKAIKVVNDELTKLNLLQRWKIKEIFQGYQIANAFVNAFMQEQDGVYSAGTLERIIATYMWQKAEIVDDLPFLFHASIITHEAMKDLIKPLIENPELLQGYYDAGRYNVIWAYIYREKLMLDAKHVPIIKYRTTTVGEHSIPDCFETAMHNNAGFFCFKDGSFDPTIWKEGSELHQYYTEFRHTTPNDPKARSKWATMVAKKPDVLYYTPSKKMNDISNTIEAVPGIINMFKIMAHLGSATNETWEHIRVLETLSEPDAKEQLSALFQLLMADLTGGSIVFDHVNCSSADSISDRIEGHKDFTGTFKVTLKDRLPFEWKFMSKHSIFKCNTPSQKHDERAASILSHLPLFTALKSHYMDLRTLITSEMSHRELTQLLMTSDLRSPDLRREIMPVLLESHIDFLFIKNILKQAEKEHDDYEIKEIIRIFNKNIKAWLSDSAKKPIVMDLIRSAPKIFAYSYGDQSELEYRALHRSLVERFEEKNDTEARVLAIELMQKSQSCSFIYNGHDPILPYVHFFKNATGLNNIPFFNKAGELFDFTGFDKLDRISFVMPNNTAPTHTEEVEIDRALSPNKIHEFVQKIAPSVNQVSFYNINTADQLLSAYNIILHLKKTRNELKQTLDINLNLKAIINFSHSYSNVFKWAKPLITSIYNLNLKEIIELSRSNPELCEWAKPLIKSIRQMTLESTITLSNSNPESFKWVKPLITGIYNANITEISELSNSNPELCEWAKPLIKSIQRMALKEAITLSNSNSELYERAKPLITGLYQVKLTEISELSNSNPKLYEWAKPLITGLYEVNITEINELSRSNPELYEWAKLLSKGLYEVNLTEISERSNSNPELCEWVKPLIKSIQEMTLESAITLSNSNSELFEWAKPLIQFSYIHNLEVAIELSDTNPKLFEWLVSRINGFSTMDFIKHDKINLFKNIQGISNFNIVDEYGKFNRSLFNKVCMFEKLNQLDFDCTPTNKYGIVNDFSEISIETIIDQLPQSLEKISFRNISSVDWSDFEPFIETLAKKRPSLSIDMNGSKAILESRPRMMDLINDGRIVC